MTEVRVSSTVRYTGVFTPSASHSVDGDTVAYWKCQEATGTTAFDSTANGWDLTLWPDAHFGP